MNPPPPQDTAQPHAGPFAPPARAPATAKRRGSHSRRVWLIGTTLAAFAPTFPQARGQADAPPAAAPNVFPIDEAPFSATLWGVDAEGHVTLRTGNKLRILAADELAYYGAWRETEAGPQVLLTDGSCLHADLVALDDQRVVIGDASGVGRTRWQRCELPRRSVRAVVLQPPAGPGPRDRLLRQLAQDAADDDRLWLVGGSHLTGRLQAFVLRGTSTADEAPSDADALSLLRPETGQVVTVPLDKVRAVVLRRNTPREAELQHNSLQGKGFWLGLEDGSLLQVREVHARRDPVRLVLAAGGTLTLPPESTDGRPFWSSVTYLEPVHTRIAWLSDLEPVGYKHLPFIGATWPLERDRNVLGGRLRTADAAYRKGLGMPSAARVAYDTAGYRRFQAELALDAAAGLRGSVVYKVLRQLADGTWEPAYTSPLIRGGDLPLPMMVDCRGAVRLALLVDFGEWAHEGDLANWLMARLTR